MEPDEYERMDEVDASMWWYRALHARLLDVIPANGEPFLDAGCGTGGFMRALRRTRPDTRIFGLEFHEASAIRAAAKSGCPLTRGSINQLPFADGSFGTVISADVLCHQAVDIRAALAELRRVLRPGGRLIVNLPAFQALMSAHDTHVQNARRVNRAETLMMLTQAGFHATHVDYWNGLLLPIMIAHRKIFHRSSDRSDVAAFPTWLDRMLHVVTELERALPFRLPAGGSVLAIAERT